MSIMLNVSNWMIDRYPNEHKELAQKMVWFFVKREAGQLSLRVNFMDALMRLIARQEVWLVACHA